MPPDWSDQVGCTLDEGLTETPYPLFAGAVCGVDDGRQTCLVARGLAYAYVDAGISLPEAEQRPVSTDTLFDLASVTKLFTATVVMGLVEQGLIGLDLPVGRYLHDYARGDRRLVTIRQLLTHTSGLPAEIAAWRDHPDPSSRRRAILRQPLEGQPGAAYRYSCVGYLTLGFLVEAVLGQSLDLAVEHRICGPLGLTRTSFRPLTSADRDEIAATEMRRIDWAPGHDPNDADPRGVVHDENAASLGGVAGNAGLFARAADLLVFGRAFLSALATGEQTPFGLSAASVREMLRPQLPNGMAADYQTGLGWRIDDRSWMPSPPGCGRIVGHPGFTGTSLLLDASRDLVCVLLTNRVHPSRTWSDLVPFRRRLSEVALTRPGRSGDC